MRKLTIENFLNEMSYDLRMEELSNTVLKYQEVVVEYFVTSRYSYKERKRLHEVCEIIRSDRYLTSLDSLISNDECKLLSDLAFVLISSVNFPFVDKEVKGRGMALAYQLREPEFEFITSKPLREIVTTLSVWTIKGYEVDSFFRVKSMENIISKLPAVLMNALGKNCDVKSLTNNLLYNIIMLITPDVKPLEVVTAFMKTDYPYENNDPRNPFATRLRAFAFELCGMLNREEIETALEKTCISMMNFNKRHPYNQVKFDGNKYMDFDLLKQLSGKNGIKETSNKAKLILKTADIVARFRLNHEEFASLF